MQHGDEIVRADGLRKAFGSVLAVDEVSFIVAAGEIFGVLGPNGAGKTTVVECLVGAIKRDGGVLTVLGVDPAVERARIREKVGYQLQATALPPTLKVGEVMRMFAALYSTPADTAELLRLVGLDGLRGRRVGALSGGERQRLSIATALVGRPQVAVFDELTTGLDPQARREIWKLVEQVRATGVSVILVSHALDETERLCDRLVVIERGRVKFLGTPSELRDRTRTNDDDRIGLEDAYILLLDDAHLTNQEGE